MTGRVNEEKILAWARESSDEIVASFWKALCETVGLSTSEPGWRVLDEVQRYGGNSIANLFRDKGVPYAEVAYDVAGKLAPLFDSMSFDVADTLKCEHYVLEKMELAEDDLRAMCDAVADHAVDKSITSATQASAATVVMHTTGKLVAKQIAEAAGDAAAKKLAETLAKKAARKAAKAAAQAAAERVAIEVSKKVMAQIMFALNGIMVVLVIINIAGPAFRKTIPAVTYIALLRKLYESAHEES